MKLYVKAAEDNSDKYSDCDMETLASLLAQEGDIIVNEDRYRTRPNEVAYELADELEALDLDYDYVIYAYQEFVSVERADGEKISGSDYDKLEPIANRRYGPRDYNYFNQTRDDAKNRKADALFVTTRIHYTHMD